jgi:hypothetical protein
MKQVFEKPSDKRIFISLGAEIRRCVLLTRQGARVMLCAGIDGAS